MIIFTLCSIGEPWYNSYNRAFQLAPRVKADSLAVSARSLATYFAVVHLDLGVVGFGIAQLCYGLTHFIVLISQHYAVFGQEITLQEFMPVWPICAAPTSTTSASTSKSWIYNTIHSTLGWNEALDSLLMTCTSILKHFLTEADKIALTVTASHYDQGVYAVTHNYGSLVVRLFFQPLEETCRIAFSRMAAAASAAASKTEEDISSNNRATRRKRKPADDSGNSTGSINSVDKHKKEMADILSGTLKVVLLFGMMFPLFGPAYARLAVKVALGAKWYSEETIRAISAFCFYIFVMGLNGVTEAFMQAAAVSGVWSPVNISLLLSSGCFLLSAPTLIKTYGTTGIIVANSLSMLTRIVCSTVFIVRYLDTPPPHVTQSHKHSHVLRSVVPGVFDVLCMMAVVACTMVSSEYFATSEMGVKNILQHVAVGGVCFLALVGVIWTLHRHELKEIARSVYASKKNKKEE
jgi:oligosaccharide translocation protein RFT1